MKFWVVENGGVKTALTVSEVSEISVTAVPRDEDVQARVGWRIEEI